LIRFVKFGVLLKQSEIDDSFILFFFEFSRILFQIKHRFIVYNANLLVELSVLFRLFLRLKTERVEF